MFTIVPSGRGLLLVTQECVSPAPFAEFRLHPSDNTKSDFAEFLPFEAMLELKKRGWYYTQRTPSRKLSTYTPGSEKHWFFHKTICGYYLRVLLLSEKLFSLGLREVCHFQASTYYKTLLSMMKHPNRLNDVKPWQSHAFYKVLQQQAETRGTHTARDRIIGGDFESDHVGGIMSPINNPLPRSVCPYCIVVFKSFKSVSLSTVTSHFYQLLTVSVSVLLLRL